jgi:hypothetical protein
MPSNEEQCVVALWRGYVDGCFYARPPDADIALAVSPSFRIFRFPGSRRLSLEEDPAATGSLRVLEERLAAEGWQRMRGGPSSAWYGLSFRKPARTARREDRRERMVASADGRHNGSAKEPAAAEPYASGPARSDGAAGDS